VSAKLANNRWSTRGRGGGGVSHLPTQKSSTIFSFSPLLQMNYPDPTISRYAYIHTYTLFWADS
jgi:hypothetical protein